MKKIISIKAESSYWNILKSQANLHNHTIEEEFNEMLKAYVK